MSNPAFERTDHRPWPLPDRPWRWSQSWRELLFAHWRIPAEVLRPHVPPTLRLQEFDGSAWVGIVPFLLGVRPRLTPWLPGLSRFPELNVRTYVEHEGRPGVWFFSLDAGNAVAVWTARRCFHLPYFRARMRALVSPQVIVYSSTRLAGTGILPEFEARYGPASDVVEPKPGGLEHFLTERYCLYAVDNHDTLHRCEVHHAPWPLQRAWAEIRRNSMLDPLGVSVPDDEPVLHFARTLDVAIWPLRRV